MTISKFGLNLGLARPAQRPAAAAATPAVSPPAVPPMAPLAAAADPGAAQAALGAVVGGTAGAQAAAPPAAQPNIIDFFPTFLPNDFTAGVALTESIKFRYPGDDTLRVVDVNFDGTKFSISSPENSGITFDVTNGTMQNLNTPTATGLVVGDVIIINNIPGRTEKLRWTWQRPTIQPAAQTTPPPAPAPVAVAVANGLTTPLTLDANDNGLTLTPADICFRVETLRKWSEGVWAAMVANGYQGSIAGMSSVGHTRKGKGDPVNLTGIGYAVVQAADTRCAPTEVCIAAEGTNAAASGLVIAEILAQLTRVDPKNPLTTSIEHVASLVKQGINAAHDSIRGLAVDADEKHQGTTVQVSIKNKTTVVNLWIGDTVGFAVHAKGRYFPARSREPMPFTPPDVLKSDGSPIDGDIADEVVWLKAAGAGAKPIRLGQEDTYTPTNNKFADGSTQIELDEQGGWYGMATSKLLGKGLALGNIREAILGANADEIYRAPHRIMEKWVKAVDFEKKLQIRGSAMSSGQAHKLLPELRTMTDGSIAFWLGRVPLKRQRGDAERKAAIAILRRLSAAAKPGEFAITDEQLPNTSTYRLLGAAELAGWGRYNKDVNIIRGILGIPATTP